MTDYRSVLERAAWNAPSPDLELERILRRRDRRRRNQRITAGVVGIAVFVAAIWVVTSGRPADRSLTPGGTGPTVGPGYPGRIGIVGLPSEDAIPSSPSRGELVVGFMFGHSGGDPGRFNLNVYADGRLIWQKLGEGYAGGDPTPTGLVEQRLTPEGVELIKSEVLSLGILDRDRHLVGGYVPYFGEIEVRDGGRLIRVTWGDVGPQTGPDTQATPEQAQALQGIDVQLEDLASWLPASAWEDEEMKAYVASRYSVCYEAEQGIGLDRVLSSFPRPAEDMLRPMDRTHGEYGPFGPGPAYDYWCSAVRTEQARALAEVLDDAGIASNGGDVFGVVYQRSDRRAVEVSISFAPLLPHEG